MDTQLCEYRTKQHMEFISRINASNEKIFNDDTSITQKMMNLMIYKTQINNTNIRLVEHDESDDLQNTN